MRSATDGSCRTASSRCAAPARGSIAVLLQGTRVISAPPAETLPIGCYGRFVPEDSIQRQEDDAIGAEPCDFNEPAE